MQSLPPGLLKRRPLSPPPYSPLFSAGRGQYAPVGAAIPRDCDAPRRARPDAGGGEPLGGKHTRACQLHLPTATSHRLPLQISAWAALQRAAGQDAVLYRARALLVLALYDVCWLRNTRVPAVSAFLGLPPADQLHFVPGEAAMINTLCNGHTACGYSLSGQKEDIVFQVRTSGLCGDA